MSDVRPPEWWYPVGLWNLFQVFELHVLQAHAAGMVNEQEIVLAFVGYETAEMPRVIETVAAGMVAAAGVRAFVGVDLHGGEPVAPRLVRDLSFEGGSSLIEAALRAAEEAERSVWADEPPETIAGTTDEPDLRARSVQQCLALMVEVLTARDLGKEFLGEALALRVSRYSPAQRRWIYRSAELVLMVGRVAIGKLQELMVPPAPPRRQHTPRPRPRRPRWPGQGSDPNGPANY